MTDRTELRRWLGGMQSLAECEGIYDGNASVRSIVVRVLPLLDQLDAAEAALARVRGLHASSGTAESQGYGIVPLDVLTSKETHHG